MANYEFASRTNYFKVTDVEKLKEFVGKIGAELWDGEDGTYAFGEYNLHLDEYYDEESDEYISAEKELQKLLSPGEVVVITEVGNEKLRYLRAIATIITSKTIKVLNFEDIIRKEYSKHTANNFDNEY
jgi:hypothetical protein